MHELMELVANAFEAGGAAVMVGGVIAALVMSGAAARARGMDEAVRAFRHRLGRAIILGLEFLVAADIVRTISTVPTIRNALALGLVVLIRTFLSFALEVELEGRWPWQRGRTGQAPDAPRL